MSALLVTPMLAAASNKRSKRPGRLTVEGFSLVETVITIMVIAVALTAVTSSMDLSVRRGADPLWQARAVQMMQSYFDDILALRFQDETPPGGGAVGSCTVAGPEAGESDRGDYDDVDDYDGLVEQGQFLDTGAGPGSQYQISVSVLCRSVTVGSTSGFTKVITITMTGSVGETLVMSAMRGDF